MIHDTPTPPASNVRKQAHPACFICALDQTGGLRLQFTSQADGAVCAEFGCNSTYEGYPGMVHGGVISAVLDGAMTNCLFAQGQVAVTADLHVRFRHPLYLGRPAFVKAWITRTAAPLFVLMAEIVQDGQVRATATGKFMHKRNSTDKVVTASKEPLRVRT